jgi:hypothetical protein
VLGPTQVPDGRSSSLAYVTITRSGLSFQTVLLGEDLVTPIRPVLQPLPDESRRFGLDPLSLAATDGVAFAFLSSGY